MEQEFYTPDEAKEKKREFAAALMRFNTDPVKAAREVESRVMHFNYILQNWQYDNEVNNYMKEIRDAGGLASTIPTKEEFAATIYREGSDIRAADIKLDYFKLFAQVMGFIEKGGVNVNTTNNVITQRNVVVLPQQIPAKELEAELMEQQRNLINYERN